MNNFLTTETNDGLMDIYVSSPLSERKSPIVIVLQEAFGINPHIRSLCDRLAQEGFLAAAPDLYHREGRRIIIDYQDRQAIFPLLGKLTNNGIIQDVRETINFLDNLPLADTQNVSTMGFCVGGFAAALCATKLNLKNMISFYGAGMVRPREGLELQPIISQIPLIKSRCLFFFGEIDSSIPLEDREAIESKLKSGKVKNEIVVFPDADHGFFCDERKTYDQNAATKSWEKALTLLKRGLDE